jgi:(S)-ureidoglycine aminohydrolase
MDISASTRTVVKSSHALITSDGYIGSVIPGWTGCTPIVIINEQMGAGFSQIIVSFREADGAIKGTTLQSQLFCYVVEGKVKAVAGDATTALSQGQFVYIPPGTSYDLRNAVKGGQLLIFSKTFRSKKAIPFGWGLIVSNGLRRWVKNPLYTSTTKMSIGFLPYREAGGSVSWRVR